MDRASVSVVILAFNSARYLPTCLDELAHARGANLEVIVVDNGSADASAAVAREHCTAPRVIETGRNLGCAGGNNVGWRAATRDTVLFLNPDCCLEPEAISLLAGALAADPGVGAAGGKLRYPNTRTLQHAGGILHPNAMAEHRGMGAEDRGQFDEPADVDYVTGAALAVRRADLEALGGLDEDFWPAYYEETDLCARLRASGRRIRYTPAAVGYHWETVGLEKFSARFVRASYRSRVRFIIKNNTAATFFRRFLPFESRWFLGPHARGFRAATVRSWASGAAFALRCLFRFSRRPAGVRNAL